MIRALPFRRGKVVTTLYCAALLSIIAVSALAVASIYFAETTKTAAQRLYRDSFVAVASSTRLELLLQQHRRIVESSPAELDRARLDKARTELEEIGNKLAVLVGDLMAEAGPHEMDRLEARIASQLPDLFSYGDRVYLFAHEFAQDKADRVRPMSTR